MAIANLFGRGIGFGGPEWIPTHGFSSGTAVLIDLGERPLELGKRTTTGSGNITLTTRTGVSIMTRKYRRKLNEDWVFDDLCVRDRAGNRQTIYGVNDLTAALRTFDGTIVLDGVADGVVAAVDEVNGDASTYGDLSCLIDKADLPADVAIGNTYKLDFRATVNGEEIAIPEENYVIIEVV
jgi:hypothetical protein